MKRPKRPKNKTGKKYLVVRDDLKKSGPGIYAILPYERLDRHHNALFKIGYTTDINRRIENYHTYFPAGIYCIAFLMNPPFKTLPHGTNTPNTSHTTRIQKYVEIEKFIMGKIVEKGGHQLYSTTRVKTPNSRKWGKTEWLYTNDTVIHEAFAAAQKKYGGELETFNTNKINKTAKIRQKKAFYNGNIYYI